MTRPLFTVVEARSVTRLALVLGAAGALPAVLHVHGFHTHD